MPHRIRILVLDDEPGSGRAVSEVLEAAGYAVRQASGERLKAGGLVLDAAARTAALSGRRVRLTRKEFDLLAALVRNAGRMLPIEFLLRKVWGYDPADYSDPHTIGVHVSTLRRKIGPRLGARIVAVPGLGYRFE